MIARDHDASSRGAAVRCLILPVVFGAFCTACIDLVLISMAGAVRGCLVIIGGVERVRLAAGGPLAPLPLEPALR